MRLHMIILSLALPLTASAADAPDWVRSGGTTARYESSEYLTGFSMSVDANLDAARNGAAADLATRITVRIENEVAATTAEKNGVQSYAASSLTRATSDVRLTGLEYETFVGAGHAYALAHLRRDQAAAERRTKRAQAVAKARELLAAGQKAEAEKRESDALSAYYAVRICIAEAAEHDSIARAILPSASVASDCASVETAAEDHVRALLKRPNSNVAEAVATLVLQLKQQGITNQAHWTVSPLTFGTTSFSSAFGRDLAQRVERLLAEVRATDGVRGDLVVKGTYVPDGESWRLAVLVREAASGRAIASAEVTLPKSAIPSDMPVLPANFEQALKDQRLLGEGEAVSGELHLELWTSKGRTNLVFAQKDEVSVFMRVNRPAYVRLIYILSDGHKVPLDQAYFIDASKVNLAVEYPDKFEVSPPFGVEQIYAVAFTDKQEPLPTTHLKIGAEEYDVVADSTENLVKHRGFKRKQAGLQTAEATVAITTTPQ